MRGAVLTLWDMMGAVLLSFVLTGHPIPLLRCLKPTMQQLSWLSSGTAGSVHPLGIESRGP